jgi:diketogulonate reductase-like aldo/keto reductase
MMKTVTLSSGQRVPALGIGTWKMGENSRLRSHEVAALRRAIDLGMTVIDTAEMYGEGAAEELIGEAIRGRRQEVFLVSKVYPHNATRRGTPEACERSLRRLGVDSIDLYLLHWRGSVPLAETLDALAALQASGKIGSYGVSNFDTSDMDEAWALDPGRRITVNQILYNLTRRGVEIDLLPWLRSAGVPVMAYSPVEQGRLLRNSKLAALAKQRGAAPAQIALAWLLAQPDVIVIPKAGEVKHVDENRAAADIELTAADLSALNSAFPRPLGRKPLEML